MSKQPSILCLIPIVASLLAPSVLKAAAKGLDYAAAGSLPVEVMEFRDLWDPDRPSVQHSGRWKLFSGKNQNEKSQLGRRIPLKVHIPRSGGPYPIVIVSHGAGGDWDSLYAQAKHLASHGFAVFSIEHVGSNTERLQSSFRFLRDIREMVQDSAEVMGRPKDVQFAIDQATQWNRDHPQLKKRLDLKHIGLMGHSFGAFTVMITAGMRPALDWLVPSIPPGKGLGPAQYDSRVRCAVALSPQGPGEPFFLPESYRSLRIPILGISGTQDKPLNGDPPTVRYESFRLWPPMQGRNRFLWLDKAAHLDFADSTGSARPPQESPLRADVQQIVRAATLLFFLECTEDGGWKEPQLTRKKLQPYERGSIRIIDLRQN